MKRKQNKVSVLVVAVVLIALLGVGSYGIGKMKEGGSGEEKSFTVQIQDQSSGVDETIKAEGDQEVLEDWLRENKEEIGLIYNDSEYGMFVTGFYGDEADEGQQEWWCVSENGESSEVGVGEIEIDDGDEFLFELKRGY